MRAYRLTVLAALLPTVAAGWLYIRAQLQMGVELDPARLDRASLVLWYVLTPWIAAFVEETVWRPVLRLLPRDLSTRLRGHALAGPGVGLGLPAHGEHAAGHGAARHVPLPGSHPRPGLIVGRHAGSRLARLLRAAAAKLL